MGAGRGATTAATGAGAGCGDGAGVGARGAVVGAATFATGGREVSLLKRDALRAGLRRCIAHGSVTRRRAAVRAAAPLGCWRTGVAVETWLVTWAQSAASTAQSTTREHTMIWKEREGGEKNRIQSGF